MFSNSYSGHVGRIINYLGLDGLFEDSLDYDTMNEDCKPQRKAYEMMLEVIHRKHRDVKPEEVLFLDDSLANLKTAKEFGMKTILVGQSSGKHSYIDSYLLDIHQLNHVLPHFHLKTQK